jgi:sugar transferase (PEP-CTERM/EpsH1 system associated)
MADVLFLAHRIPYPPDKGDKIRSWNILKYLSERYRVHLGCFIDDPRDWQFTDMLKGITASAHFAGLGARAARIRGLVSGLATGEALSLGYFRDRGMRRWVNQCIASHPIDCAVIFSSPMAQYVIGRAGPSVPTVIDFVDVDSDKWTQYAKHKRFLEKWIYGREARTLLAFERRMAADAKANLFVSPAEADLFRKRAPEVASTVHAMNNGVDLDFFSPERGYEDLVKNEGPAVVFTGAMDYWANVDAVRWFVHDIWPTIRSAQPAAKFYIVGGNPTAEVKELAREAGVVVTGRVADVRPYIARADAVVAPMRIARGVQNKVLEGMAMARPVVTTPQGLEGIDAIPGRDLLVAEDGPGVAAAVNALLSGNMAGAPARQIGANGRRCIVEYYSWGASLGILDDLLIR